LNDHFLETDTQGIGFIDPKNFPETFPLMAAIPAFRMGIGEGGIDDPAGMSTENLSSSQKEYLRVGQQVYKIALSLRTAYNKTIRVSADGKYKDVDYEEFIHEDVRKHGTVRHLLAAILPLARKEYDPGVLSSAEVGPAREHVSRAFEGLSEKPVFSSVSGKPGHFRATIKGYPVVFVRADDHYAMYLASDYKAEGAPGRPAVEIPYTEDIKDPLPSSAKVQAEKALIEVDKKVEDLLSYLETSGRRADDIRYENGRWLARVGYPAMAGFRGLPAGSFDAEINFSENGRSAWVEYERGGLRMRISPEMAQEDPNRFRVLTLLMQSETTRPLAVFSYVDRLRIKEMDENAGTVTVVVGNGIEIPLAYVNDDFEIVGGASAEETLLDERFAEAYIDALNNDPKFVMNKHLDDIKNLLSDVDESWFVHFWDSLFGSKYHDNVGTPIDSMSGSIPEYFAYMVADVSKFQVLQKLRQRIVDADSLSELNDLRTDTISQVDASFSQIKGVLAREKNSDLSRMDFETRILGPLRAAAGESDTIAIRKKHLETNIYDKLDGVLAGSDFDENSHRRAAEYMKYYLEKVAHVDNPDFTFKNPDTGEVETVKIDLDKLPVGQELNEYDGRLSDLEDPNKHGYYILNYMDYAEAEVMNALAAGTRPNIENFDSWKNNTGRWERLDTAEMQPAIPFKDPEANILANGPESITELEKQVAGAFNQAFRLIRDNFKEDMRADGLDHLKRYLYNENIIVADGSMNHDAAGVLYRYKDKSGKWRAPFWQFLRQLGNQPNRRAQHIAIADFVEQKLYDEILSDKNRDKYFPEGYSLTDKARSTWRNVVGGVANWAQRADDVISDTFR